jgi:hypothetical protein
MYNGVKALIQAEKALWIWSGDSVCLYLIDVR